MKNPAARREALEIENSVLFPPPVRGIGSNGFTGGNRPKIAKNTIELLDNRDLFVEMALSGETGADRVKRKASGIVLKEIGMAATNRPGVNNIADARGWIINLMRTLTADDWEWPGIKRIVTLDACKILKPIGKYF